MQFDYDYYFSMYFTGRVTVILIFTIVCVANVLNSRKKARGRSQSKVQKAVGIVWDVAIWGAVLLYWVYPLFQGGFTLLHEKEADAVLRSGVVEELQEQPWYYGAYYKLDDGNNFGWQIVIDGETYRMQHHANLSIGDEVSYTVLPESGFILSIDQAE